MKETSSQIKDFTQLIDRIKESGIRKRVAIVWPEEEHTQLAIRKAVQNGFISPTLFCSKAIEEQYEIFFCIYPRLSTIHWDEYSGFTVSKHSATCHFL